MLLSCTLNKKCTLNCGQKAEVSDIVYRFLHSDESTGITVAFKMDKNPGFVMNLLMKVDMGIFYWIMCTFRAALTLVDGILFLLLGYTVQHGSQEEWNKSDEYEHSAQLVTLLGRGAYTPIQPHQLNNFVWKHDRFVHPSYVLHHDNITLMGLTPTHAFFCVSDPDFDIYDTKVRKY